MACSVVCVSHTTGSGGGEVGKRVAEQLGYLYVDEEIVSRAAAQGGLEPGDVADEERRQSFAARVLQTLAEGGGDPWTLSAGISATMESIRPEDVRALIRETVVQTAARGNVVIVARARLVRTRPRAENVGVFVTSSPAGLGKSGSARRTGSTEGRRHARSRTRMPAGATTSNASIRSIASRLPTTTWSSTLISSRPAGRRDRRPRCGSVAGPEGNRPSAPDSL